MLLFADVRFHIAPSLPPKLQSQLHLVLVDNGATQVPLTEATHVVTNSTQFEGWETVSDHVAIVTDKWVTRSILAGKLQQPQFYSANPSMLFSGVVACSTGLPTPDIELLSDGITAFGGQWRTTLTRDVTHLFAATPGSEKYETALLFQEMTQVKVVLPQWFDDAVRLGTGSLPTAEYEWPEPRVLSDTSDGKGDEGRKSQVSGSKKLLFKTAVWSPGQDLPDIQVAPRDIWQKRRILLSPGLGLTAGRRHAVEAGIERTNGILVRYTTADGTGTEEEAVRRMREADVFITRYRSGPAYVKAVRSSKTIGTLAWVFHVESTGVVSSPMDQLLHYPIPKKPIEGFSAHEITVTNYTGEAREYLKKLISAMGAEFTPSMTGRNTVLIAAYLSGTKATKARTWSIPIVNHTWLEDCFVQWRNLTVGLEKYIVFPPGVDFSKLLGERGVGKAVLEINLEGLEEEEDTNDDEPVEKQEDVFPAGTDTSGRDENEVEEVVGLFGGDDDVFLDNRDSGVFRDSKKPVSKTSPRKTPTKKRHLSFTPDDNGIRSAAWTPHHEKMGFQRKVPQTPEGMSTEVIAGSSRSRRLRRAETPADEAAPSSSPIDSPSNRKTSRNPLNEDSSEDLGLSTRKRKLVAAIEDEDSSEFEAGRRSKVIRKLQTKPVKTVMIESDNDEARPCPPGSRIAPSSKVEPKTSPQKKNETAVASTVAAASPVRAPHVSPRRVPSVVIQTSRNAVLLRAESMIAVAAETPSPNKKRERPRAPSPPASVSDTSLALYRSSTKRSAATKAIQKLHDEVMPDVLHFQQEMKRSAKGKGKERVLDRDGDDGRVSAVKAKYKSKSKSRVPDAQTAGTSDEERRYAKKRKSVPTDDESYVGSTSLEPLRTATRNGESHSSDHEGTTKRTTKTPKRPPVSSSASTSRGGVSTKSIKLMTTQVNLTDDVLTVLTRLGVKVTTKPSECTHLLAPHVVRTEKFLCALAVAPFILSESWALESAVAKKLLPENDYLLQDAANEEKFSFTLTDALSRAKKNGGRLFVGHAFYVTPKVPVDLKLLRNIVTSGGGQLLPQTPTLRILKANANRHVVSCDADASIWRPLADQDYPIYTHELVLTGTLKQKVDWEDPGYRVPSSLNS